MLNIKEWYFKEVERWRLGASVAWLILLLPAIILTFLVLAHVRPTLPLFWLFDGLSVVLSPSSWSYIILQSSVLILLATYTATYHTVRVDVAVTRLSCIRSVLNLNKLLLVGGHGVAGSILTWGFVSMVGGRYGSLTTHNQDNQPCLNEHHVFIVVHGWLTGAVYAVRFLLYNHNQLSFSIIQQEKFFQVKGNFMPVLYGSFMQTLSQLRFFYPAYYLFIGSVIKSFILQKLNLDSEVAGGVDSLAGMLDVALLWQVVLSGTLVTFLFKLTALLYTIYQTESFEFELESELEKEKSLCLDKALDCGSYPLVQYLGYLGLLKLSSQKGPRRSFMYELSQPGGHPHHWNTTSAQCLTQLKSLADSLNKLNDKALASQGPAARQLSGDPAPVSNGVSSVHKPPVTPSRIQAQTTVLTPGRVVGTPGRAVTPGRTATTPTRLTGTPALAGTPAWPADGLATQPDAKPPAESKLVSLARQCRIGAFFLEELPDTASRRIFRDCQLYIWAVEALSNLVSASYHEDRYGVVQKSLPDILTTLLSLQESVERHMKLCPVGPVNRRGSRGAASGDLRAAFRSTLKSALYRIVETFHQHLGSLSLSAEHSRRLNLFIEYKE